MLDALQNLTELAKQRVHEDGFDCRCLECLSYGDALDCVDDGMTEQQALTAILEGTTLTQEKAHEYVAAMVDTGVIQELTC